MTPTPERPAELVETHISVVVFIGDRAYKLKKPVSLGFLDFSTRERRLEACRREVELNRRLAPDAYLGVIDVTDVDGEVADHLVVMRRMPVERRLSTLVAEGDPRAATALRDLARLLADFHSRAERSPAIDADATADAVLENWEQSFTQLAPFAGDVLDAEVCGRIVDLVRRYVAGRGALFDERIAGGHICDGHGDLQAADIFCLDEGPQALDCIEFSDSLRHGDVVSDVAFLAMDLDRLGAPELGEQFLRWYREYAGEQCPTSLIEHYIAYRAHVRCKVNCLRLAQTAATDGADPAERAELEAVAAEAQRLARMTLRYLERAKVRLVLVGGLPGTGKSTLARGLATTMGWTVLRSDEIRKELAGVHATDHAGAQESFEAGLYDPAMSEATYGELLRRAAVALRRGETVVLDASWTSGAQREAARRVGGECSAEVVEVACVVDAEVAADRLTARLAVGGDASDATPAVAARLAERCDPWPQAGEVSSAGTPEETLAAALDVLDLHLDATVAVPDAG